MVLRQVRGTHGCPEMRDQNGRRSIRQECSWDGGVDVAEKERHSLALPRLSVSGPEAILGRGLIERRPLPVGSVGHRSQSEPPASAHCAHLEGH